MPWCPKCKAEYVEGKTVCIDCGTELLDELPTEPEIIEYLATEKEKFAEKFVQFLKYSNVENVSYEYDETKGKWIVYIYNSMMNQVDKLYDAFYSVETEKKLDALNNASKSKKNDDKASSDLSDSEDSSDYDEGSEYDETYVDDEDSDNDADEQMDDQQIGDFDDSMFDKEELNEIVEKRTAKPQKPATYVKKEDQYKDLQSSGITFIVVSGLGIVILVLNAMGIIRIMSGLLPYIVMGGLFVAFIGIGISSLISAKRVKSEVAAENSVTDAINAWLSQNVTAEQLDSLTKSESNPEIRFFHKLEKMKQMINEQFGELDDSYLDTLVEEYYNNHFE